MIAEQLGLQSLWRETEHSRAAATAPLLSPRGADFVVECSGADGAAREAVRMTRKGGAAVLLSVTTTDQRIDATDAVLGEKTITVRPHTCGTTT